MPIRLYRVPESAYTNSFIHSLCLVVLSLAKVFYVMFGRKRRQSSWMNREKKSHKLQKCDLHLQKQERNVY